MKIVYESGGIVQGITVVPATPDEGSTFSGPEGSTKYQVDDAVNVRIGWSCTVSGGIPSFAAPD